MALIFLLFAFAFAAATVMATPITRLDLDETAKWFPKLSFKQSKGTLLQFETRQKLPTRSLPRGVNMTLYTTEHGVYEWNQIEIEFKAVGDCRRMQLYLVDGSKNRLDNKKYPFNTIKSDTRRGYVTIKYLTKKIHAIYPDGTSLHLFIPPTCALTVNHAKREFQAPFDFEFMTVEHTRGGHSSVLVSLFSRAMVLYEH